jgi:hypothetical protein
VMPNTSIRIPNMGMIVPNMGTKHRHLLITADALPRSLYPAISR